MTVEQPPITLDPSVLAGKLVIRGSRLSVEFVIGLLADGWSEADILANYPITHKGTLACLSYARDTLIQGCGTNPTRPQSAPPPPAAGPAPPRSSHPDPAASGNSASLPH